MHDYEFIRTNVWRKNFFFLQKVHLVSFNLESSGSDGEQQSDKEEEDEGDGCGYHVVFICLCVAVALVDLHIP